MDSMKKKAGGFLAALLLATGMASCGDPEGFGLGEVVINDGGEHEVSVIATAVGGFCDFAGSTVFAQVIAFKTDADLGGIVFGSDTILDLQEPPADTEPLANANIVLVGVDGVIDIQHSNNPNADFFVDTNLVLDTTSGIATISTGDEAVSYVVMTLNAGAVLAEDSSAEVDVDFVAAKGGDDFQVTFVLECQAP